MSSALKRHWRPSHYDAAAQTRSRNYALCITSGIVVLAVLLMSFSKQPQRMLLPAAAAGPVPLVMRIEYVPPVAEPEQKPVDRRLMADNSPFSVALPPQDEPEQPKETPKPEETLRVAEQKPKVQPPAPKPKPAPDKAAPQKVQPPRLKDAVPGPRNQEGHPQGNPDGGIAGGVPGGVPGGRAGGMDGGVAGGVPASTRNMALSRILSAVEKHKNYPKHARRSGAEGLVILRDGDPGEPEVTLSPPRYHYQHRAEIEALVQHGDPAQRDTALDTLLETVAQALDGQTSLGGLVDYLHIETPDFLSETVEGAPTIKAAVVPVILEYSTSNPLN